MNERTQKNDRPLRKKDGEKIIEYQPLTQKECPRCKTRNKEGRWCWACMKWEWEE